MNLYSSAVFIGWACVLAGLGLEGLFANGIGNLVAAISGALTLMVAYGLDTGDTMHVLQAVLDTQFWLSTHVITVTLGYGATFLAGVLGIFSIVHRIAVRRTASTPEQRLAARQYEDQLYRMTYGTNQLGIGLHSYGFTSGVLMLLAGFVASQLLLIAAGWLLTRPDATPDPGAA